MVEVDDEDEGVLNNAHLMRLDIDVADEVIDEDNIEVDVMLLLVEVDEVELIHTTVVIDETEQMVSLKYVTLQTEVTDILVLLDELVVQQQQFEVQNIVYTDLKVTEHSVSYVKKN